MNDISCENCVTPMQVRVAYADVDQMGVVYYGHYLRWFELGRAEYLRARGRTYREIEAEGLYLPVVESYVRYCRPAGYDDVIEIQTHPRTVGRVQVTFGYQLFRVEGDSAPVRLAEGHTSHACTGKNGRPRRFPADLLELLQRPLRTSNPSAL